MGRKELVVGILVFSLLFMAWQAPSALAADMEVKLAWDPNTETDLAGYNLYYGTIQGGPYEGVGSLDGDSPILIPLSSLADPANPGFTVRGLPESVYYFVVTAYNTHGLESTFSNQVSVSAPVTQYQLSASVGSGSGTISPTGGTYDAGTVVTLTATPAGGYRVASWTGTDNNSSTSTTNTVTMNANRRVTVSFTAIAKDPPTIVGYPVINYAESSITITYSEDNMRNAALADSYSFDNGLLLNGVGTDTSGANRVFRLPLKPGTLQPYIIYTMQISSAVTSEAGIAVSPSTIRVNDDDNDGMADDWEIRWFGDITATDGTRDSDEDGLTDLEEYQYARSSLGGGGNRWDLSPLNHDSDGDGIPDGYEVFNGLDPVDASDRDLDLDQDGWTNHEEYLYGTSANDPASFPEPREDLEVLEVIPVSDSGLTPEEKGVQNTTGFSVRIESVNGLDLNDPDSITLTVMDGIRIYTRKLNDLNGNGKKIVRAVPLDAAGSVAHSLWAVYYRSNETGIPDTYPSGSVVEVTVNAKDRLGDIMDPVTFRFKIQSEEEKKAEAATLPETSTSVDSTSMEKTVTVLSGPLMGAVIVFPSTLLQEIGIEPYFGPTENIPPLNGVEAVGAPLNLLPDMVFPSPVTLMIPCPGYEDVKDLEIYYYDGRDWWQACDKEGSVRSGGEGWMVPGSRINHNKTQEGPALIEIQVYHFSGVLAADTGIGTVSVSSESASGGGGCFISTLGGK